jgi:hypothetical protein
MPYSFYDCQSDESAEDGIDIEDLRDRVIRELEAAYFGGIGPAVIELAETERCGVERLLEIARDWGVL